MANWTKEEQAEHRRLWVKALRSGNYEQARGALAEYENRNKKDPDKFCCLGVACDISGLGIWSIGSFACDYVIKNSGEHSHTFLPPAVQHWLGLKTNNGHFDCFPEATENIKDDLKKFSDEVFVYPNLGILNDVGRDFMTISKIIEYAEEFGMLED